MIAGNHFMQTSDFTVEELTEILTLGSEIKKHPDRYKDVARGKILATLFYEPSTRTKFSFESAMYRLGGNVIGFSDPSTTSGAKGETLQDTMRVISYYADIAAMRHPRPYAPMEAAEGSDIPVINAGDGGNQHPTQTMTDLLTILALRGRLTNLTIGLCGDLKYGRTVHSLFDTLSRFEGNRFVMIAPEELSFPKEHIDRAEGRSPVSFTTSLEDALGDRGENQLDFLYMTRIQRERFEDISVYERLKNVFILDEEKMAQAPADMYVMHPLPRVNEITEGVDKDPRARYFEQAHNGVFVRMALIAKLLGLA